MKQTALQQLIEIIKQKRNESEISNTLLKFVHDEAEKLLETEKKQQDEYAINFAEWTWNNELIVINGTTTFISKYNIYTRNELLKIYKKEKKL